MRVLVTGSAGFLGQALVSHLREQGFYVIGWDLHLETQSSFFIHKDLRQL